jgi:hypothetical protein
VGLSTTLWTVLWTVTKAVVAQGHNSKKFLQCALGRKALKDFYGTTNSCR